MSYMNCIVASCDTRRRPNTDKNNAVKCFSFPKDPILKMEWLNLCKVRNFEQAKDSNRKVCIKHFKEDDFVDGLKARLLNLQPKRLKKNAVPSLFLGHENEKDDKSETIPILKNKTLKQLLGYNKKKNPNILKHYSNIGSSVEYLSKLVPIAPKNELVQPKKDEPMIPKASGKQLSTKYFEISTYTEQKSEVPGNKILQIKNMHKKRIIKLLDERKKLLAHIETLDWEVKKQKKQFTTKVKEALSHVLTPNQVNLALGTKYVRWTDIEFARALILRNYSQQAYSYMKDILNYPLPDFSVLQQWELSTGAKIQDSNDKIEPPLPKQIKLKLQDTKYNENKENDVQSEGNSLISRDINLKQVHEFTVCDKIPKLEIDVNQIDGEYEMETEIIENVELNYMSEDVIYNTNSAVCIEVRDTKCNIANDIKTDDDGINQEIVTENGCVYYNRIDNFNEQLVTDNLGSKVIYNPNCDKSIKEENG